MDNRPTAAGWIVLVLLVIGLAGGGYWFMTHRPAADDGQKIDIAAAQEKLTPASTEGVTTQKDYAFVPEEKLPPVKGVSGYKNWNASDPIVRFPVNVWIGWLPIVAANHGANPNTESIFYKKYGFKVQLILIDDPVAARDAFATGDTHCLWGTLDMMALFAPGLMQDSRTAPRICQQIDWSSGGDGIVVRDPNSAGQRITSVGDLKGKTIAYAQNSPSQYYISTLLIQGGVQPTTVSHKYTKSAFEASAAFVQDTTIDACVSWAPDIYNIVKKVPGTKLLSTTADASKLIADVWAVRADFAKDNPKIVKGLVDGIFEAMATLEKDEAFKAKALQWMADFYKFPVADIKGMTSDAHSTNFAENKAFFTDASNPTNFEQTWNRINFVYGQLGRIDSPVAFDQVMDFSIIKGFAAAGMYAGQKDTYSATFNSGEAGRVAEAPLLKKTIRIQFYPNSNDPFEPKHDEYKRPIPDTFYDPNVTKIMKDVATLAGQFDKCVIRIVGHTDASMKGQIPEQWVIDLSTERADAVRKAMIEKFKFPPEKFQATGVGWNEPVDPNTPNDDFANRRVEINVYPVESE